MVALKPGNLVEDVADVAAFQDSMAAAMEDALSELLALDDLPRLKTDPGEQEVRDRRRLFVAIARGVVGHLVARKDAIDIRRVDNSIVHPETIRTE